MKGLTISLAIIGLLSVSSLAPIALADSGPTITGLVTNPGFFNSTTGNTTIAYNLSNVTSASVLLEVYDSSNRIVRTIDGGLQSSSSHLIAWDGDNDDGIPVSEGIYNVKISVSTGGGNSYQFLRWWGGVGSTPGRFNLPTDVSVDLEGSVYVADYYNKRVQKFNSDGTFLTTWNVAGNPHGIATDSNGNVYVADHSGQKVLKFDSNGSLIVSWGVSANPHGIAVDSKGNVYLSDLMNNRILKFDSAGNLLAQWGSLNPFSIAVDANDYVYITQLWAHRMQKFDSSGRFIVAWGSKGAGNGQFNEPRGVAVDSFGRVYVGDSGNDRIQVFDSNGNFITQWGSEGKSDGQFQFPNGLAIDASNNVYLADAGNHRVQVFASASTTLSATTSVTVDNTPPALSISVSPEMLWPPNHKMVEITATANVSDNYDPSPDIVLSSVAINELDVAKKIENGNTISDIQSADMGNEDYNFLLRAEIVGYGRDRVYTITYTATDAAGNSAQANATVTVPHDLGQKNGKN